MTHLLRLNSSTTFFLLFAESSVCEGGMGLAAREGVTATLVCSLLLLFCGSRPVDCQRRDLQRVIFPPLVFLLLLLQVIQQLRSSPRYRPTRRPAGQQVTILILASGLWIVEIVVERCIIRFMRPCETQLIGTGSLRLQSERVGSAGQSRRRVDTGQLHWQEVPPRHRQHRASGRGLPNLIARC